MTKTHQRERSLKVLNLENDASDHEIKERYEWLSLKYNSENFFSDTEKRKNDVNRFRKGLNKAHNILIDSNEEKYGTKGRKNNVKNFFKLLKTIYKTFNDPIKASKTLVKKTKHKIGKDDESWINEFHKYENYLDKLSDKYGSNLTDKQLELFAAFDIQNLKKAKDLISKIKNLSFVDTSSNTPLHYLTINACLYPNSDWEKIINKCFKDSTKQTKNSIFSILNASDALGDTPLHIAVNYGNNSDLIEILLLNGADLNKLNKEQNSPVILAASHGKNKILELFLEFHKKMKTNRRNSKCISDEGIKKMQDNLSDYSQEIREIIVSSGILSNCKIPSNNHFINKRSTTTANDTNSKHSMRDAQYQNNQNKAMSNSDVTEDMIKSQNISPLIKWSIISMAVVISALALYFLAPLIVGTGVGTGVQLLLGAIAGGGGVYLTDVTVTKCHDIVTQYASFTES